MKFDSPLLQGRIVARYKRFLVDVILDGGNHITAHCPNSGAMTGCIGEGWHAMLTHHDVPERKLKYTLEMTRNGKSGWIGVNTGRTNCVAAEAIQKGYIKELSHYRTLRREVKVDEESRLDILLSGGPDPDCYVEVKSVTLLHQGSYQFPDAITRRGQRHLERLMELRTRGFRAVNLFLIQRGGGDHFRPANHIDSRYGELLRKAHDRGVEVLAYECRLTRRGIGIQGPVRVELDG